jgi:hypothetical protein
VSDFDFDSYEPPQLPLDDPWVILRCPQCGRRTLTLHEPPRSRAIPPDVGLPPRSMIVHYSRSRGTARLTLGDRYDARLARGLRSIVVTPEDHGPLWATCDRDHVSLLDVDELRAVFEKAQQEHRRIDTTGSA